MIHLSTLDTPPPGQKIETSFGIVEVTYPIRISQKGLLQSLVERKRNEHDDALEALGRAAPAGANAIIGIGHSSATQTFDEGTFLYLTYVGTAVRLVEAPAGGLGLSQVEKSAGECL